MATFSGAWTSGRAAATASGSARPSAPKIRSASRREGEQRERGEHSAGELQLERAPEEPAQASPVLGDHVAEAVLRQRVLHRQVEQGLEETRRRQHSREEPELDEAEPAGRDDVADDAERPRAVEPDCGRRAAPEKPGAHRGRPV